MTDTSTEAVKLPEHSSDHERGSVDWLIDQLNNADTIDQMVSAKLNELRDRVKELEAPRRVKALAWEKADESAWLGHGVDVAEYVITTSDSGATWDFRHYDAPDEGPDFSGELFEVQNYVDGIHKTRIARCLVEPTKDALAKTRSEAINDFCARLGLKMTDEVKGLPDDVRLFRAQAAIRAEEGETPCSFKTEHVYNTCAKCGADDVKGCQKPKGGKDDQACDP